MGNGEWGMGGEENRADSVWVSPLDQMRKGIPVQHAVRGLEQEARRVTPKRAYLLSPA